MKSVVVVGGGLAGLAAARALSQRGCGRIALFEVQDILGGKAASWLDADGLPVEVGLHVCFRYYRHLRGMLQELGADDAIVWSDRALRYVGPGGSIAALRFPRLPSPLHGLVALARHSDLRLADRLSGIWGAAEATLAGPSWHARYEHICFAEWARRRGLSSDLLAQVLEPIVGGLTFLRSDQISARAMLSYIRAVAARSDECHIGCFKGGSGDVVVGPLVADLRRRGVELRTACEVESLTVHEGRVAGVRLAGGVVHAADCVIVAVPSHRLQRLLPGPAGHVAAIADTARLQAVPVASVIAAFDRRLDGPAGLRLSPGCVFNTWADMAEFHPVLAGGPSVLQFVVAPMTAELSALDDVSLAACVLADLRRVLPASGLARVVKTVVTRTPESFHAASPGASALRPDADVGIPGLLLAGDYVGAGRVPNMEAAVASGLEAAHLAVKSLA